MLEKITPVPFVTLDPCHADFVLHCCDEITTYGSYVEHKFNSDRDSLTCRICGKHYRLHIRVVLEEVEIPRP